MSYHKQSTKMVLITAIISVTTVIMVGGQNSPTIGTCATSLTVCLAYINGTTTPPTSCCTPLKDAVTNQKDCLCNLYANPALLTSYGVNVTKALNLPLRCHIQSDSHPADFCKGTAPSGSPTSSSNSPPTGGNSSSGSGSGSGSNSAVTITGTGFVSTLLVLITYVIV